MEIDNIIDFYQLIQENEVVIKFQKKDKSIRFMRCTLNYDIIPESNRLQTINMSKILKLIKNSKLIHVYDLDNQGWRSLPFERAEWLETINKEKYEIKIKGGEEYDLY